MLLQELFDWNFNPRTPCGVRRFAGRATRNHQRHFNPRTPCGVRPPSRRKRPYRLYFNPRTPCGVRLYGSIVRIDHLRISIHAPRAGCDIHAHMLSDGIPEISIHAPRAGCDHPLQSFFFAFSDFNPRTPCGVRRRLNRARDLRQRFQSTHPVRGATIRYPQTPHVIFFISIHAPRAGCDLLW